MAKRKSNEDNKDKIDKMDRKDIFYKHSNKTLIARIREKLERIRKEDPNIYPLY